jgi:hypothetical protein
MHSSDTKASNEHRKASIILTSASLLVRSDMDISRKYEIVDQSRPVNAVTVSKHHFGSNVVTSYDEEFADGKSLMSALTKQIGVSELRFPGGAVTEILFDMTSPNDSISYVNSNETLLPMDAFFREAGSKGMDVTMVLPTRIAFTENAAESMLSGTYGDRREVSKEYLANLMEFVGLAINEARENGVRLTGFEIGNEFWASGQMTASEYGFVAGAVSVALGEKLAALNASNIDIIVQSHSSASELYSPRNDTTAYVGTKHGMPWVFRESYVQENFDDIPPDDWVRVTIPGQGAAYQQVLQIAQGINAVDLAADSIDGLVQHYYQNEGFAGVDNSHEFFFSQFDRLALGLSRSTDLEKVKYHVSEWNTNARSAENNRGSQHASMMMENFYQLVSSGVESAFIWPLTFDTAQNITLLSKDGNTVTLSGEMFRLMSDSLIGLKPFLDWSTDDGLDVHGFASQVQTVLFISERSGHDQQDISLSFSEYMLPQNYFVTGTELWDNGAGGDNPRATAFISHLDGKTVQSEFIDFDIKAWANLRIEITAVSEGADRVFGRAGNDTIYGFQGSDVLHGGDGNDLIRGGVGDDKIYGGTHYDTLFGGDGNDEIWGGLGRDTVYMGRGNDVFHDHAQNDFNGADTVFGGDGDDIINGGGGKDVLYGEDGNDWLAGGKNADTFVFESGHGADTIVDFSLKEDMIRFDIQGLLFADLKIYAQGMDTLIDTGSGTITLFQVEPDSLTIDCFWFGA